ncbi:MAG: 5-oxoprolinase (ATP-hydrolyzing) subunit [Solirubrobacteraceae bacterium]|nr:5-oxoprolinase (ATP-hydrolyzing) subunit [Solirubrobacteraceae bacterium]
MAVIDLNADVGERGPESLADDLAILDAVTSANVACGFHAGDPDTMRAVCAGAVARDVRIGAHVGYDDRPSFGRVDRDVAPDRLRAETATQLDVLAAAAAAVGGRVSYVKPHGALYSRAAADRPTAEAIVDAAAAFDPGLAILGPPDSRLLEAAAARGLTGAAEGFADRAYLADGRLVPRTQDGSVLTPTGAVAQAEEIACAHRATAADGTPVALDVASLCLHSDTPGAAGLARALRARLERAGVEIRAFA